MRDKNDRAGFTLIELMVVVVIIGMLAVFVVPRMFKRLSGAKQDLVRPGMALIVNQLEEFAIDCGRYPTDSEGLNALSVKPADIEGWNGPYLKSRQLLDPWKRQYQYIAEGQINQNSYDLVSFGADGQEGGEEENADIFND